MESCGEGRGRGAVEVDRAGADFESAEDLDVAGEGGACGRVADEERAVDAEECAASGRRRADADVAVGVDVEDGGGGKCGGGA